MPAWHVLLFRLHHWKKKTKYPSQLVYYLICSVAGLTIRRFRKRTWLLLLGLPSLLPCALTCSLAERSFSRMGNKCSTGFLVYTYDQCVLKKFESAKHTFLKSAIQNLEKFCNHKGEKTSSSLCLLYNSSKNFSTHLSQSLWLNREVLQLALVPYTGRWLRNLSILVTMCVKCIIFAFLVQNIIQSVNFFCGQNYRYIPLDK